MIFIYLVDSCLTKVEEKICDNCDKGKLNQFNQSDEYYY